MGYCPRSEFLLSQRRTPQWSNCASPQGKHVLAGQEDWFPEGLAGSRGGQQVCSLQQGCTRREPLLPASSTISSPVSTARERGNVKLDLKTILPSPGLSTVISGVWSIWISHCPVHGEAIDLKICLWGPGYGSLNLSVTSKSISPLHWRNEPTLPEGKGPVPGGNSLESEGYTL